MYEKAKTSAMSAKQLEIDQYHSFVAERIDSNNTAIADTLSRNSLPLFHDYVQKENKSHSKILSLKRDCHLFSIAYQAQENN